jgi:putative tryptophan/tyrosine transport system substrate-binding protein
VKRREFITLLGCAAIALPLSARAQERMRLVAVLTVLGEDDPEVKRWFAAFQEGLQRLGWEQGRNIRIEYRSAGGDQHRLRTYAAELVGMAPDVLLAAATPALVVLQQETRSVPIVFAQVSDPVKLGFVANLVQPGGNMTGFANFEHPIGGKWIELIRDISPGTTRIAVIFDSSNAGNPAYLEAIEAAALTFKVQVTRADVRNADEIKRAITTFAEQPSGAVVVVPSAPTIDHRDLIIALAARHRLPAVYPYRFFSVAGGCLSYGVDLPVLYRQAAGYVDRILKGSKPGDLPVQFASKFELVVNLKTAKALGLTIPEPFLQAADEVIE